MRFLQINLNHCRTAQDLIGQMAAEVEADVVIISEPYRALDDRIWTTDKTKKAAIWTCGKFPFQEIAVKEERGYVVAKVNNIFIFSCYAPPSLSPHEFQFSWIEWQETQGESTQK